MKPERASHLALLLGRFRASHEKQLALLSEWRRTEQRFFLGWQCARQEEMLLCALRSLNSFLIAEGLQTIPEHQSDGENIEGWHNTLLLRSRDIEKIYKEVRSLSLGADLSPEELFPELGGI